MRNYFFILLLAVLSTSCSSDYMTLDIISQNGTRSYEANFDHLWDVTKGALLTEGYEIAYENREKGVINTKRKFIKTWLDEDFPVNDYRQYLATVKKMGHNQFEVTLKPRKIYGNFDRSAKKAWTIEGKHGEVHRWNVLFNKIERLL